MKKIAVKIWYLILSLFPLFCSAQFLNSSFANDVKTFASDVAKEGGYETGSTASIGAVIASLVLGFMALLGIIFIILIILAGWKYLNARGDEQKTKESLDQIRHAVIGLIIIIASYSITYFVFNALPWGGTGGGGYQE
ncbi:MAG: hypothetical protein WC745_00160 [Patescibacteria group bacterium]|jgi:hypothetical protein